MIEKYQSAHVSDEDAWFKFPQYDKNEKYEEFKGGDSALIDLIDLNFSVPIV